MQPKLATYTTLGGPGMAGEVRRGGFWLIGSCDGERNGKDKSKMRNAGVSPLRRQNAPPPVEMTEFLEGSRGEQATASFKHARCRRAS